MKPSALIDASASVSAALRTDSKPHQALRKALDEFELCVCAETLAELEAVLSRPQFLKYAPAEALSAFADLIRTEGTMFEVSAED